MAAKRAARWEIDLSAGGASSPRSVLTGSNRAFIPAPWPGSSLLHDRKAEVLHELSSALRRVVSGDPESDRPREVVGGRGEAHVNDVYPAATERDRQLGEDAWAVVHGDAELVDGPALDVCLEQAAAMLASAVVPGAHGPCVAAAERLRDLLEAFDRRVHLVGDGGCVLEVDVRPDAAVRAGDARGVAEARADPRERLVLAVDGARGLRDEHVRQHVRQVADRGEQTVVRVRVERDRACAEAEEQAVQALVEHAARASARRQVPGGALEQVGARVLDAGGLGARDRMTAHEALVPHVRGYRALRRAHVRDDGLGAGARERLVDDGGQGADGRAGEDGVRAADGIGHRGGLAVDRAALACGREYVRVGVEAGDLGAAGARSKAYGPADQADAE